MEKRQIALIIFDGWGMRDETEHNAIALAKTPYFDYLWKIYPHSQIQAGGSAVGLPEGEMGNSEIGHMTIGAGTVLDTDVVRISKAVANKELGANRVLTELFAHVKQHGSTLHIQGLISPGGIHSHQDHLHGLLAAAKEAGVEKVAIHAFTDGRDTAPQSARQYLETLEATIEGLGIGYIATATGRFYAMDRDNNWDRIAKAEAAIFECKGNVCQNKKPSVMMQELYEQGIWDEHVEPIVFLDDNGKGYKIEKNDGVLFFNFRADRARQLSKRIAERVVTDNLYFATLTEYDKTIECRVVFPPLEIKTTLAAEISKAGLTQAHIAETEKYAHVTYFLNGGKEQPFRGEAHSR